MRVRAIDVSNDFTFGKGRSDYRFGVDAVAQSIKTRLQSFLGDCFFDLGAGVDWFFFMGSKRVEEMKVSISACILNTQNVTYLEELSVNLSVSRHVIIQYRVRTVLGLVSDVVFTSQNDSGGGGGDDMSYKTGIFNLLNNQSGGVVSDFVFSKLSVVSARMYLTVYRKDSTKERASAIELNLIKKPEEDTWILTQSSGGDNVETFFDFIKLGNGDAQIVYNTSNFIGSNYLGIVNYELREVKI